MCVSSLHIIVSCMMCRSVRMYRMLQQSSCWRFFFLSFHNLLLVCKCTSDAVPNVAIAVAAVAAAYPFFFCLCSDRARAPQLSADTQYWNGHSATVPVIAIFSLWVRKRMPKRVLCVKKSFLCIWMCMWMCVWVRVRENYCYRNETRKCIRCYFRECLSYRERRTHC